MKNLMDFSLGSLLFWLVGFGLIFGKDVGLLAGGGFSRLGVQALGVAAAFLWAFPVSFAIFYTIKLTVGLRASEHEELYGLDLTEHGLHAYPTSFVFGSPVAPAGAVSEASLPVPIPEAS